MIQDVVESCEYSVFACYHRRVELAADGKSTPDATVPKTPVQTLRKGGDHGGKFRIFQKKNAPPPARDLTMATDRIGATQATLEEPNACDIAAAQTASPRVLDQAKGWKIRSTILS